jgi:hypothetical protein
LERARGNESFTSWFAYIGVQPNTLATWRSTHRYNIPFIRVGSRIFYRKADLDEWLAARRVTE